MKAIAQIVCYTPNLSGNKHTTSTFVDWPIYSLLSNAEKTVMFQN